MGRRQEDEWKCPMLLPLSDVPRWYAARKPRAPDLAVEGVGAGRVQLKDFRT